MAREDLVRKPRKATKEDDDDSKTEMLDRFGPEPTHPIAEAPERKRLTREQLLALLAEFVKAVQAILAILAPPQITANVSSTAKGARSELERVYEAAREALAAEGPTDTPEPVPEPKQDAGPDTKDETEEDKERR